MEKIFDKYTIYEDSKIINDDAYTGETEVDIYSIIKKGFYIAPDIALTLAILISRNDIDIDINTITDDVDLKIIDVCKNYTHPMKLKMHPYEVHKWLYLLHKPRPGITFVEGSEETNNKFILNWKNVVTSSLGIIAVKPIPNTGETCYLSSTLQIILSLPFIYSQTSGVYMQLIHDVYIQGYSDVSVPPDCTQEYVTNVLKFKYGEPEDALACIKIIFNTYKIAHHMANIYNASMNINVISKIEVTSRLLVVVHHFDDNYSNNKFSLVPVLTDKKGKKFYLHGGTLYRYYGRDMAHYSAFIYQYSNIVIYDYEKEHPLNDITKYTPRFLVYFS